MDSYVDLNDPVERELLYHQTLHNIRNDRFPLTDSEAMLLVAIRAQLEFGDNLLRQQNDNHFISETNRLDDLAYTQLIARTLPERLAARMSIKDVRTQHQIQSGMDQTQSKAAFFNLIQSWPLHRATVFEVLQTYTSSWPKTLWLAIDQNGMHLLQPRTRVWILITNQNDNQSIIFDLNLFFLRIFYVNANIKILWIIPPLQILL